MNVVDLLKHGQQAVDEACNDLGADDWQRDGVLGTWSIKTIVAHLIAYEEVLLEALRGLPDATQTERLKAIFQQQEELGDDGFNAQTVAQYADHSGAEVLAALQSLNQQAIALAESMTTALLDDPAALTWYIPNYTFADFAIYVNYGHKRESAAQIAYYRANQW